MRILLVDDSPVLRTALRRILNPSIDIVEAGNGLEGWKAVIEAKGQFDIVITDMSMPEMDGKGFFLKIQESYPELAQRVIFQTGGTEHLTWLKQQGQPVLAKPYQVSEVQEAVGCLWLDPASAQVPLLLRTARGIA